MPLPADLDTPIPEPEPRGDLPLTEQLRIRREWRAAERARVAAVAARDWAGPPVAVDPLPPGAFVRHLIESGQMEQPAVEPTAADIADAAQPVRVRALRLLADNLSGLEDIVRSRIATPSERTAALAQIARIADAYSDDGPVALSSRPLCTLTYAELCQRVAEIDIRRAQLQARIAAHGRADPAGGGGFV